MPARTESFLKTASVLFMAGRMAPIASSFSEPFTLHLEDTLISLQSRTSCQVALHRYRRLLHRRGVTAIIPRIAAQELPRRNRFRTWVEVVFYAGTERLPNQSKSIFYGRLDGERLNVEMIHFLTFAQPEVKRLIPDRAWSA